MLKHARERSHSSARKFQKYALLLTLLLGCGREERAAARQNALVVILPREPEQLDPRYVGDAYGFKVTRLMHASLARVNAFTLETVPDLAERIDV
ncbi:MAG TPA: hypothetical protein VFX59_02835, partial [Polyangiales bacterium]|nr:hypothetical protein [Polyangiales bacterium]